MCNYLRAGDKSRVIWGYTTAEWVLDSVHYVVSPLSHVCKDSVECLCQENRRFSQQGVHIDNIYLCRTLYEAEIIGHHTVRRPMMAEVHQGHYSFTEIRKYLDEWTYKVTQKQTRGACVSGPNSFTSRTLSRSTESFSSWYLITVASTSNASQNNTFPFRSNPDPTWINSLAHVKGNVQICKHQVTITKSVPCSYKEREVLQSNFTSTRQYCALTESFLLTTMVNTRRGNLRGFHDEGNRMARYEGKFTWSQRYKHYASTHSAPMFHKSMTRSDRIPYELLLISHRFVPAW